MKSLVLDVYENRLYETEFSDHLAERLSELYKALDCSCIDMVERKIGRKYFTIVCDDEGLLREDVKISAINNLGGVMLVGNLAFVNVDDNGYTVGLSRDEINYIKKRIQPMCTQKYPNGYLMLTQCEY